MLVDLRVPFIDPHDDATARITNLWVEPGQRVENGDAVIEMESQKSVSIVYANKSGLVTEVHMAVGDTVRAGDPIYSFELLEMTMRVVEVLVTPGTRVHTGQPILIVEVDGNPLDVPADFTGTVHSIYVGAGQYITDDDELFEMEEDDTELEE